MSDEPFGLAIRTYAPTPRHAERYLEACLTLRDADGTWIPGYGWMFPAGDGTVNIGVGSMSTMRGFRNLNLRTLLDAYKRSVADEWDLGDYSEKPRAWRLPMSHRPSPRSGVGGHRRRSRADQPHERRGYRLRSGVWDASRRLVLTRSRPRGRGLRPDHRESASTPSCASDAGSAS